MTKNELQQSLDDLKAGMVGALAGAKEGNTPDERARTFCAYLSGWMQRDNPELAGEIFGLLLSGKTTIQLKGVSE